MSNLKLHHNRNAKLAAAVTNHIKMRKRQGVEHKVAKTEAYLLYSIKNENSPDVNYTWLNHARDYFSPENVPEQYYSFLAKYHGKELVPSA
jgi:hypothetical protein